MIMEDWIALDWNRGLKEPNLTETKYPRVSDYLPGECANIVNLDVTPDGLMTRRGFIGSKSTLGSAHNQCIVLGEAGDRVWYSSFAWNPGDIIIPSNSSKVYDIEKKWLAKLGRGADFTNSAGYTPPYGVRNFTDPIVYGGVYEYAGKVYLVAKRNVTWINITDNVTFSGPPFGTPYPATDPRGFHIPTFVWRDRVWLYDRDSAQVYFSKAGGPTVWDAPDGGVFTVGVPDKAKIAQIIPATDFLHIFTSEGYYTFRYGSDPNRDGQLINIRNEYSFSHALSTKDSRVFALSDSLYEVSQGQLQDLGESVSLADAAGMTYFDDTILVYFANDKPFKAYNIVTNTWSNYIVPFNGGKSFEVNSTLSVTIKAPSLTLSSSEDVFTVNNVILPSGASASKFRPVVLNHSRDAACYEDHTPNTTSSSSSAHAIRYRIAIDGSSIEKTLSPFTWSKFKQAVVSGFWPDSLVSDPLVFSMVDIYGYNDSSMYSALYESLYTGGSGDDPKYMEEITGVRGKILPFPSLTGVNGSDYFSRLIRFGMNQRARRPVFFIDLQVGDATKLSSTQAVDLAAFPNVQRPSIFTGLKVSVSRRTGVVNSQGSVS